MFEAVFAVGVAGRLGKARPPGRLGGGTGEGSSRSTPALVEASPQSTQDWPPSSLTATPREERATAITFGQIGCPAKSPISLGMFVISAHEAPPSVLLNATSSAAANSTNGIAEILVGTIRTNAPRFAGSEDLSQIYVCKLDCPTE